MPIQCGINNPAVMIREIKKQKLVDDEEYEEGLGGKMLKCFMCKNNNDE